MLSLGLNLESRLNVELLIPIGNLDFADTFYRVGYLGRVREGTDG